MTKMLALAAVSASVALVVSSARTPLAAQPTQPTQLTPLPLGQSHYTEGCGGCHGLVGVSDHTGIPTLRNQAGWLMCSTEGREFGIRLPNVAFANMDDATLAATMNFVVFSLGGQSVPAGARPYSANEIARLRKQPLKASELPAIREAIRARLPEGCPA